MNEQHRTEQPFTVTMLILGGGLLIWMAHFLFVYVFAALACARRFTHLQLFGLPIVPLVTTLAGLIAAFATVVLLRRTARRNHHHDDENAQFIRFVALATSAIALIGLIWVSLPPLLVMACESP